MADFEDTQELATPLKDGWGITSDGSHLVVGDSSDKLTWLDPDDVSKAVREVAVSGEGGGLSEADAAGRGGKNQHAGGAGGRAHGQASWRDVPAKQRLPAVG